jgi:intracellular septation protein A
MQRHLLLAISMYWRVLLATFVFIGSEQLLLAATPLLHDLTYLRLQPTVLYGLVGVLLLATLWPIRNGLIHLLWGSRLVD